MRARLLGPLLLISVVGACGGGAGGEETGAGGGSPTGQGGAGSGSGAGGAGGNATGGASGGGGAVGSGGTGGRGGGGGSGGAAGSGGATGTGGMIGMPAPGCQGMDSCPAPNGAVVISCEKRFHYGVNYAWASFGSDFGGGRNGVAMQRAARLTSLQDMQANGVDVIRWWVFPNFQAGGVAFDASGAPTGFASSTTTDIAAALDIAAQASVHIQFTLFSFDNFKTATTSSPNAHNLAPIISDATKRAALMQNVVTAFANEVAKSANKDRAISWDVINEPEWAVSGNDGVDMAFTPQTTVTTVTYDVMKTFITEAAAALHAASNRPVTVGNAAIKWAKAWAGIGDFYTFHMYDWVNMSFPYDRSLAQYGVTDKPVVLGEFPIQGLTGVSYATLVGKIFDLGYAGAMAWAFNDSKFPWTPNKPNVKAFADSKGCVTKY